MPVKNGRGVRLVLTPEYRIWKQELAIAWKKWKRQNPKFKPYVGSPKNFLLFQYQIFLENWRKDAQNHEKAIRDGLEGLLYKNDRYVFVQASVAPVIDKKHPRIEVNPRATFLSAIS